MTTTLRPHRLTGAQFDALAAGGGGPDALDALRRSQLSKRLLLLHQIRRAGPIDAADEVAWTLLDDSATAHPDAVWRVLSRPFVDVWADRRLRGGPPASGHPPGSAPYLLGLAAAASVLAGTPFELPVPPGATSLLLPGIGRVEALDRSHGTAVLSFDGVDLWLGNSPGTASGRTARGIRLPFAGEDQDPRSGTSSPWSPYRAVACGTDRSLVEIDDLDPHRRCFGLPPTGRLGTGQATRAARLIAEAWDYIDTHLAAHRPTVLTCLRSLVPVDPPGGGSASASCQRAFGAVAASLPTDAPDLALLLIHETAHAKLGALLDLVPLVGAADTELFHAPWRSDPRPALPLLQGAYAHAAVADFWRVRRRQLGGAPGRAAQFEFAFWHRAARRAVGTLLDSSALTPHGRRFVTTLAGHLDDWTGEAVDPPVRAAVTACGVVSDIDWRLRNHQRDDAAVTALAQAYRRADSPAPPPARIRPDPNARSALSGGLARAIRTRSTGAPVGTAGTADEMAARVAADPSDADRWGMLALTLMEAGRDEAVAAITTRPDLVRHLLELVAPGDGSAVIRIARWLAGGDPPRA